MSLPVHYLVIGHVARDLTPQGWRLGGSAAYAALTARAFGYTPGIVTAASPDLDLAALDGAPVQRIPSPNSTTFENIYHSQSRTQYLRGRAAPLTTDHVPTEWRRAPIVHLAPLARELAADLPSAFPGAFVGLTMQGWLRQWDTAGLVSRCGWPEAVTVLPQVSAAVLSIEDVDGDWALLEQWAQAANLLVVTEGARGCTIFVKGRGARQFAPPPHPEADPTGAGDIFAAAFFIHLYETRDPWAAARVANHVASVSITRPGLEGAPTPEEAGLARVKAELS
jgi:sugar/nucleoside kinase (ribokinase family)